jgi:hypothetical protein
VVIPSGFRIMAPSRIGYLGAAMPPAATVASQRVIRLFDGALLGAG